MTNLEKLSNANIYDLLVSMNTFLLQQGDCETCILESLEQKYIACSYDHCEECIQNYLNKEVKEND